MVFATSPVEQSVREYDSTSNSAWQFLRLSFCLRNLQPIIKYKIDFFSPWSNDMEDYFNWD